MRILLTGATGFIGQNMLNFISNKKLTAEHDFILLTSREIPNFHCINHKNYSFSKNDFIDNGVDYIDAVIHLGAASPKTTAESSDYASLISNISNTNHLINNLPNIPRIFIFGSSISVYGDLNNLVSSEMNCSNPIDLYGCSKLTCEILLTKWASINNVLPIILRLGHIYGKGEDKYNKFIPVTIKHLLANESPVIYSDGTEIRSYLNVWDCCNLIINSLSLTNNIGPINLVSGNTITISEIMELLITIHGSAIKYRVLHQNKGNNIQFDNSKMRKYLGEEMIPISVGLEDEYMDLKSKLNFKDVI